MVGTTAALNASPPPEVVRQSITGRIERLSPAQQLILKSASVIGERFSTKKLLGIYPVQSELDSVPTQLRALADSELLTPTMLGDEPGYRFACDFHWQVSNSLLPQAIQRKLSDGQA